MKMLIKKCAFERMNFQHFLTIVEITYEESCTTFLSLYQEIEILSNINRK